MPIKVWKQGSGTWTLSGSNSAAIGTSDGQFNNSAFVVFDGVLRFTNSNAFGQRLTGNVTVASSYFDVSANTTTPATGRIELGGSITIPKSIILQGRPDATNAQLANYTGSNTISGNILLISGDANSC